MQAANKSINKVGSDFTKAVKCSGIAGADFSYVFEVKEDANFRNALREYRKEKPRIEQEIVNVNRSISSAQSTVDDMKAKIKACDSNNYNSQIRNASNDMDYYKREMNKATDERKKEEFEGQYRSAQKRKEQAEAAKRSNDRNRADYDSQKKTAENNLSNCKSQKKNLEKRLSQVEEIIRLF
jgi:chromosome segregation ATPase